MIALALPAALLLLGRRGQSEYWCRSVAVGPQPRPTGPMLISVVAMTIIPLIGCRREPQYRRTYKQYTPGPWRESRSYYQREPTHDTTSLYYFYILWSTSNTSDGVFYLACWMGWFFFTSLLVFRSCWLSRFLLQRSEINPSNSISIEYSDSMG